MTETGSITKEVADNIGTITFHHPKGNALPAGMLTELRQSIEDMGQGDHPRVIVLQSRGDGAFCGGASFDELIKISEFDQGKQFFMGFANLINAMRRSPKLIIARIQGKVVGGGVGIAAAADHTLAHRSADVKLSELSIGIGPFVIEPAVSRKIGKADFSTLAIDATSWYEAKWAHSNGLYAHLYDTTEQLDEAVEQLASQLADSNPGAMRELKRILWEGTGHWDELLEERAEISGRLVLSEYTRQFLNDFREKTNS